MTRRDIVGVIAAIALVVVGVGVFASTRWRSTVSYRAAQATDVGVVLSPIPSDVTHRFSLKNDTSGLIELVEARPSCGCTSWSIGSRSLQSGQTTDVEFVTTVRRAGPFGTSIDMEWSDGSVSTLRLAGSAVPPSSAWLSQSRVSIVPGERATIQIAFSTLRPGFLDLPQVIIPDGADIRFGTWETILAGDQRAGIAARYQIDMTIGVEPSAQLPGDIEIRMPECEAMVLRLTSAL